MENNEEFFNSLGDFKKEELPIGFRFISPVESSQPVVVVESVFFQTKNLFTKPFYKPISKSIILRKGQADE